MNENLKKASEMVKNDESLKEKISAEVKRLAETMEDKETNGILARAVTNVLGIDITAEDLDVQKTGARELTPEAMEEVAGGSGNGVWDDIECFFSGHILGPSEFEKRIPGRDYYVRTRRCQRCFKKVYQKVHKDGVVENCSEYDVSIY